MIKTKNIAPSYLTEFSNGNISSMSDLSEDKGGQGLGFRPHELLEAAVANCFSISARMYAEKHQIAHEDVSVEVNLARTDTTTVFEYNINITGEISEEQKLRLHESLQKCPVLTTLTREISIKGTLNG